MLFRTAWPCSAGFAGLGGDKAEVLGHTSAVWKCGKCASVSVAGSLEFKGSRMGGISFRKL
jgi:hypothetical protein